jgi:hypothetical protein
VGILKLIYLPLLLQEQQEEVSLMIQDTLYPMDYNLRIKFRYIFKIISVDYIFKKVTLNKTLEFVQGPIIVYNAITSSVVYAPNTFGDPLSYKQIREATAMFASKAFTLAELSFSTDLLPAFVDVEFAGSGSGLFGHDEFGGNFFGGVSNSVQFRTIVPANCQRCRYLNVKFTHNTAREQYALFGITLTGKTFSTRAYR